MTGIKPANTIHTDSSALKIVLGSMKYRLRRRSNWGLSCIVNQRSSIHCMNWLFTRTFQTSSSYWRNYILRSKQLRIFKLIVDQWRNLYISSRMRKKNQESWHQKSICPRGFQAWSLFQLKKTLMMSVIQFKSDQKRNKLPIITLMKRQLMKNPSVLRNFILQQFNQQNPNNFISII